MDTAIGMGLLDQDKWDAVCDHLATIEELGAKFSQTDAKPKADMAARWRGYVGTTRAWDAPPAADSSDSSSSSTFGGSESAIQPFSPLKVSSGAPTTESRRWLDRRTSMVTGEDGKDNQGCGTQKPHASRLTELF